MFLHETQNRDTLKDCLLRPHLIQVSIGSIITVDEINNILINLKGNLKYYVKSHSPIEVFVGIQYNVTIASTFVNIIPLSISINPQSLGHDDPLS